MKSTKVAQRTRRSWWWPVGMLQIGLRCDLLTLSRQPLEGTASHLEGRKAYQTLTECTDQKGWLRSSSGWLVCQLKWDPAKVRRAADLVDVLTCLQGVAQHDERASDRFSWFLEISHGILQVHLRGSASTWWEEVYQGSFRHMEVYFCAHRWRQNLVNNTLIVLGAENDPWAVSGILKPAAAECTRMALRGCRMVVRTLTPITTLAVLIEAVSTLREALNVELEKVFRCSSGRKFYMIIEIRTEDQFGTAWLQDGGTTLGAARATWQKLVKYPTVESSWYRQRCAQACVCLGNVDVEWSSPLRLTNALISVVKRRACARFGPSFGPLKTCVLCLPSATGKCRVTSREWWGPFREHVMSCGVLGCSGSYWTLFVPTDDALVAKLSAVGVLSVMHHARRFKSSSKQSPIHCAVSDQGVTFFWSYPDQGESTSVRFLQVLGNWLESTPWLLDEPGAQHGWDQHLLAGLSLLLGFPVDSAAGTALERGERQLEFDTSLEKLSPDIVAVRGACPILMLALYSGFLGSRGLQAEVMNFRRIGSQFEFHFCSPANDSFLDFIAREEPTEWFWRSNGPAIQEEVAKCINAFCTVAIRDLDGPPLSDNTTAQ